MGTTDHLNRTPPTPVETIVETGKDCLARNTYAATAAAVGNRDTHGEALPAWEDLDRGAQAGWRTASTRLARLIIEAAANLPARPGR